MYELIILSLLMRFPLHGYLIAQIANDVIGPWAKISNGTLYPLLTKLEQNNLIIQANGDHDTAQTERSVRTFMITDTGRKRFYQLMVDTTSNIGDYQRMFHLKVPYLDLLRSRLRATLCAPAHNQVFALARGLDRAAAQRFGQQDVTPVAADADNQLIAAERQLERVLR